MIESYRMPESIARTQSRRVTNSRNDVLQNNVESACLTFFVIFVTVRYVSDEQCKLQPYQFEFNFCSNVPKYCVFSSERMGTFASIFNRNRFHWTAKWQPRQEIDS